MSQTAIIYARFSSTEQSKGFSLERQRTYGLQFATDQGWSVEKTITDEGRSAYHGANRAEGSEFHTFELEARNSLHRGKVLVVENIDRLSRQGAKAAAQLIWGLNENGVDVATFHDGHVYRAANNDDMMDLFKVIILAQQAHDESDKKSKRTAATARKREERIEAGEIDVPIANMPNWIDVVDGKKVLNKERTAVLNLIYDLYIDGWVSTASSRLCMIAASQVGHHPSNSAGTTAGSTATSIGCSPSAQCSGNTSTVLVGS